MGIMSLLSVDIRVESALYPPCVCLRGLGRAVRPCSVTHDFGLEWGPNPGAFGQTGAGPGSQLRNLGVEEATGTPCIGTPSNPVVRYSYLSFITYLSLGYVIDVSESGLEFELWVSILLL